MQGVLIFGAGNIGSLAACLLASTGDYNVYLADLNKPSLDLKNPPENLHLLTLNISDKASVEKVISTNHIAVVISCLPYYHNIAVAQLAQQFHLHYFDLTEDVAVVKAIKKIAVQQKNVFMPHCGLAPGFINILANGLMSNFTQLDTVALRAGNVPMSINNALQYALTWSLDGLINEYGNLCETIFNGQKALLEPLDDLETVEINGHTYEAFNTSGGIGSLVETYYGKVKNLNYKTLRYLGHCEKIRFLMKDLRLNEDRATLKTLLEKILPVTTQDVALIYVAVTGMKRGRLVTETYANRISPQTILGRQWTAIQVTTASGICAVMDIVLQNLSRYQGFVLQEQIPLQEFLQNRFGKIFESHI